MDNNLNSVYRKRLEKTAEALRKNNMNAYVAENKNEALEIVKKELEEGSLVACGGSVTLAECGVMELLRSGKYDFLDRETAEDKEALFRKSFCADYYLCSSNAVTENGELYNVDGTGNRVGCICYGPSKVIMLVGKNKIVKDLDDAQRRVKSIAAPANAQRLNYNTYCKNTGVCMGIDCGMTSGCNSTERICATYVVSGFQRVGGRISVILINEEVGY